MRVFNLQFPLPLYELCAMAIRDRISVWLRRDEYWVRFLDLTCCACLLSTVGMFSCVYTWRLQSIKLSFCLLVLI
jgi:hypothetical protein